jgi:spore coat polysaccharide biosynthesis predicted glycosyltransferase SpsG
MTETKWHVLRRCELLDELEKLGWFSVLAVTREDVKERIERDLTDAEADEIAGKAAMDLGENEMDLLPIDDAIEHAAKEGEDEE